MTDPVEDNHREAETSEKDEAADILETELTDLGYKKTLLLHQVMEKRKAEKRRLLMEIESLNNELLGLDAERIAKETGNPVSSLPNGTTIPRTADDTTIDVKEEDNKKVVDCPYKMYDNGYATRKTVSQGLLDFGLLTMNVTQLQLITSLGPDKLENYWPSFVLIILALILESGITFIIIYLGFIHAKSDTEQRKAQKLNDICLYIVAAITVVNIFKAGFGVDAAAQYLSHGTNSSIVSSS